MCALLLLLAVPPIRAQLVGDNVEHRPGTRGARMELLGFGCIYMRCANCNVKVPSPSKLRGVEIPFIIPYMASGTTAVLQLVQTIIC